MKKSIQFVGLNILLLSILFVSCSNSGESNKLKQSKAETKSIEKLTIVARILAKEESRELVKNELLKLIDITRAEEGCINYDLHQDNENPNLFLFYENWESRELWQKHMGNSHLKEYMKNTDGAVQEFNLNEMTLIK